MSTPQAAEPVSAPPPPITIGRFALYRLTESDAEKINRRRTSGASIAERLQADPPAWPVGAQAHIGNTVRAGQEFPMLVVASWPTSVNGQVLLDGNDTYWVTSVYQGETDGTWRWAPPPPAAALALGRIVHFRKGTQPPRAAIVSGILEDGSVDLTVFTGNQGNPVAMVRTTQIDPADVGTGWYWPPRI